MDVAYDHIQESNLPEDKSDSESKETKQPVPQSSLNAEFQDAYRAFSSSPWGARIGGFFGSVVKQGESVYREAQQELSAVSQDATRGFTDLRQTIINRTRSLSLNTSPPADEGASREAGDNGDTTPTKAKPGSSGETAEESETVLSRLRGEAAKRLKDLQKAEDAADEALLRFGSNLRDFFKDAIQIAPPTNDQADDQGNTVLFESKDAAGKRVIHTSRFDAQLHVIHTTTENFVKDGTGTEYETWSKGFDIDKKTEDISGDLSKYPELRTTMEKLVPDQVPYADFWKRYYFLRHGIETAEARRRDLLKAASAEEEVGWDEDSDEEEEEDSEEESEEESSDEDTPPTKAAAVPAKDEAAKRPTSSGSATTIQPAAVATKAPAAEPRKSNDEKSLADSDTSYDLVGSASGVPSQAPNSPKESDSDDSEEEDWE
ncbi:BSD domain-containing protein 1-B [Podospora australis]|uniref:BSD domain-containing protein 1-B n=1 Tax=Podospora australis TaxID=1536484 RepID=A0AAN7AH52_9PEZI|nr:BSD domain-containing protein 1-B [Podospora australis]